MSAHNTAIFKLAPSTIVVEERIGIFWPEKATGYGALMARDGQNEPIKIRWRGKGDAREAVLVVGYHRLQGAIEFDLPFIDCMEAKGTRDQLRLIEASENMDRRDLEPIERALLVRARVELAKARAASANAGYSPQELAAAARWNNVRNNVAVRPDEKVAAEAAYAECISCTPHGWSENVAESLGMSRRSLFDSLKIHRQLIEPFERELWEALARVPLGRKKKSLFELADIADEETRRLVIDTIVGDDMGEIKSVSDAMIAAGAKAAAGKVRKAGDSKWMDGAGTNLDRLSASGWRQFAPTLVEKIKPSALVTIRDAVLARIAAEGGVEAIGADDA